ncbi:hypothetical protein [Companilactobacillus keshanensis]|uniref:XRE family transcriptional regulator n=1 Tax=Companilactobacillus keshanensis TaxID=2486003 RepID=A0ABW4BUX4_9LACO|nr:hypothetical protein [Companilactobacillus keshanensis]
MIDEYLISMVKSPQYEMAGKIMGLSVKLGMDQRETADCLDMNYEHLLDIESSDLNIDIEGYNEVYSKLLEIGRTTFMDKNSL